VGGLGAVGVLTGGIGAALLMLQDGKNFHPSFMAFEPLGPGRYWILSAWLPFFVLNIVGEEVWRGVTLPRREVAFGAGLGWSMESCGCWCPMMTLLRRVGVRS
jgi:hypothetical protein